MNIDEEFAHKYKPAKYSYTELQERVEYMSNKNLHFSDQYGMLFILDDEGHIILRINGLLTKAPK